LEHNTFFIKIEQKRLLETKKQIICIRMNDLIDWNKLSSPKQQGYSTDPSFVETLAKPPANDEQVKLPTKDGLLRLPSFREFVAFLSINDEEIATQNVIPYDENDALKTK
jgi:hypothetical protein